MDRITKRRNRSNTPSSIAPSFYVVPRVKQYQILEIPPELLIWGSTPYPCKSESEIWRVESTLIRQISPSLAQHVATAG